MNGGVVVMNPWNGRVYALVGGYNFDLNQFNRVTQAKRQPGSGFQTFCLRCCIRKWLQTQ